MSQPPPSGDPPSLCAPDSLSHAAGYQPERPLLQPVGLLADAPEELRLRWEEHWEEIECKGLGMRNFILPEENENANFNKYVSGYTMPKRPVPLNHTGKEVNILINMHEIASFPSKPVHQFDVSSITTPSSTIVPLLTMTDRYHWR